MSIKYNGKTVAGKYKTQVVTDATEGNKGLIRIATLEEVNAGTDNTTAVTPKGLATKQNKLTAGTGIEILPDGTINNTQTSAEWGNITGTITDQLDLQTELNKKVDKVEGKSLIEDAEIERLKTLKNYDDTQIKTDITNINSVLETKASTTDLENGLKTKQDKKLFDKSKFKVVGNPTITDDGIASGFSDKNYLTLNSSDLMGSNNYSINLNFTFTSSLTTSEYDYIMSDSNGAQYGISIYRLYNILYARCNSNNNLVALATSVSLNTPYNVEINVANGICSIDTTVNQQTSTKTLDISAIQEWSNVIWLGNRFGDLISSRFRGSIDLKQFSITADGKEVFSGSKDIYQALDEKQNKLTAGTGIEITEDNVINNTQTSAEWGNIQGNLSSQTDLQDALNNRANKDLSNLSTTGESKLNNLTANLANKSLTNLNTQGQLYIDKQALMSWSSPADTTGTKAFKLAEMTDVGGNNHPMGLFRWSYITSDARCYSFDILVGLEIRNGNISHQRLDIINHYGVKELRGEALKILKENFKMLYKKVNTNKPVIELWQKIPVNVVYKSIKLERLYSTHGDYGTSNTDVWVMYNKSGAPSSFTTYSETGYSVITPTEAFIHQDKLTAGENVSIENNIIKNKIKPDQQTIIQNEDGTFTTVAEKTKSNEIMISWSGTLEEYETGLQNGTIMPEWYCYITDDETVVDFNDFANNSLSNLSEAGEKHFVNKSQITNCLLEVPQRIKYELADGTLTIKAGSVVIVPYGTEDLTAQYPVGSTFLNDNFKVYDTQFEGGKFFVWAELVHDLTDTPTVEDIANRPCYIDFARVMPILYKTEGSGTTNPSSGTGVYFNTNDNKVVFYNSGAITDEVISLPILRGTSDGTHTAGSIDQVFNGMGYIGSTVWVDKGVKGLIPNGRNEDGSLKNIETITNQIYTLTDTVTRTNMKGMLYPHQISNTSQEVIITDDNILYIGDFPHTALVFASFDRTNGVISNFNPKLPFRAVDYSDIWYDSSTQTLHIGG